MLEDVMLALNLVFLLQLPYMGIIGRFLGDNAIWLSLSNLFLEILVAKVDLIFTQMY